MNANNKIKVLTPANAAAGVIRKGDSFMRVDKRPGSKPVKGTNFYQVTMTGLTCDNQGKEEKASGFFNIENVKIQACKNPATATGGAALSKPTISARFSSLDKDTNTFLRAVNAAWHKRVQENLVKPDPDSKDGGMIMDAVDRKIHDVGQWTYSQRSAVKDKDGKLLKGGAMVNDNGEVDPIMRWKLRLGETFHEKCPYGHLRGKPKCVIRDATKPIVEGGRKTFALATVVVDGVEQPVTAQNIHLFVTPGSILVKGRYMIDSASQSEKWISLDVPMIEAIIQPGGGTDGFDDDVEDDTMDQTVADDFAPQAVAQAVAQAANAVPANTAAVNAVLNNI